jgi:multidrug efflux pump subunit AcrA (membrane-fusion protein)
MRSKILATAALLMLGGGAVYLLQGKQQTPKPKDEKFKVATAAVTSISRTVRLAGQTSARKYANITAPQLRGPESNKNLVLLELVKAGSFVHKGQVIARIDAQSTIDHLDDVKDTVEQADADIRKRKAEQAVESENLQQTLRQAKSDRDKARLDAKPAGILTPIERQLLQLNVDETEARYAALEKSVAEQKKAFTAEMRILEITAERQRRHYQRHANDLVKFTVIAPIDGLAVMQPIWRGGEMGQVEQGDQLGPGQLFAKVVDPKSMQVEARANQAETSDLRIGQNVIVRLDAFPGMQLPGDVYSIGALATGSWMQSYYKREVPVNVTINASDPRLIPDLSASAEVILQKSDDVLAIPLAAVRSAGGRSSVLVREGDQFVDRQVVLGVRDENKVAVVSGLRAGDQVRIGR